MTFNVFVSDSKVPPLRWRVAFPTATIRTVLPTTFEVETVYWLHNIMPPAVAGKHATEAPWFIVMFDEPTEDKGLVALEHGAAGYCNTFSTPELLNAIHSVVENGGLWVGESLLSRLLGGISARTESVADNQPILSQLTKREAEIALLVARGESNKEIARQLSLAERTIKAHLTVVFEKLNVRDRLQLALVLNAPKAPEG